MADTYTIYRFYSDGRKVSRAFNLTFEEAQRHTRDPETSSRTAVTYTDPDANGADWFDGYGRDLARSLRVIAAEIREAWPKPYYGAVPYIEAMEELDKVSDVYGFEIGENIVRYFLANAGSFRGDVARRIKLELKGMIGRA